MENYKLTQYEIILEHLGALENLNNEIIVQTKGSKKNLQDISNSSSYSVQECGVAGAIQWGNSIMGVEYWCDIQRKMNEILDN